MPGMSGEEMADQKAKEAWMTETGLHAYRDTYQVGIHCVSHVVGTLGGGVGVESLLFRDADGVLIGHLTNLDGNVRVAVHPDHLREGIGTALVREALHRWELDLDSQNLTPAAIPFVDGLIRKGIL